MLLVRTGGIFGVFIALFVAAIFMFVVRPAINDTTDRAFETANRALDQAATQSEEIRKSVEDATQGVADTGSTGSFLGAGAFSALVADLKAEIGADGELLDFTVNASGGNVKYREGDGAAGFTWSSAQDGLQPAEVTLTGSGKVADNVFPISVLTDDAAAKLTKAVQRKAGGDFAVQSMTLGLNPVTGNPTWTVTGEGDGRLLVYTADADTTGLKLVN